MEYILGESNTEIQIDSVDDYKHLTLSMLEQARNSIDIYTQDLEAEIYNNKFIEQAIFRFTKRHPSAQVRILAIDATVAVQNGHCLIRLAQQLTSSVFIHRPSSKQKIEKNAFVIADQTGLIFRPLAENRSYKADINFKSPRAAARQTDLFNSLWEHSTPDIQIRRIYI